MISFPLVSPALDTLAKAFTAFLAAQSGDSAQLARMEIKLDQVIATQAVQQQELVNLMSTANSAIVIWAAKEQADLTAIQGSLAQIIALILALNAQILAFQNSPGTLSANDQAALDGIQASSTALVAQAAAIIAPPAGTPIPPPPGS